MLLLHSTEREWHGDDSSEDLGLSIICLLVAFSQHWHCSTSSTTMFGK